MMEESGNSKTQQEENVSINIVQVKKKFEKVPCNIFKVPYEIRQLNINAYMPRVISIGPFHHGKSELEPMEKHKEKYYKSFKSRRVPREQRGTVESKEGEERDTVEGIIKQREESIRSCYAEPIQHDRDFFVNMILVDALFILELFFRSYYKTMPANDDPLFVIGPLRETMALDLLLYENQLPFFVLEELFERAYNPDEVPLIQLALNFFKGFDFFNGFNEKNKTLTSEVKIKHLTDLLRCFMLPSSFENLPEEERDKDVTLSYSAKQLHEAGVKFKVSSSKCLYGITVEKGVLKIPSLKLSYSTEALIRNVMALERYSYRTNGYITDYFAMLDLLIDSTQDMDLLCDMGIVKHYLGDRRTATNMVNNLHTNISWEGLNSKYCKICNDLHKFYKKPSNRWMAALRRDYFNSPWRGASTIAAFILLLLTLIQTICSIISVVYSKPV